MQFRDLIIPFLSFIPTMSTHGELNYLYWLTRTKYSGEGVIIEVGSWLGASAGYLAAGMRDVEKEKQKTLYCFDRFELQQSEMQKANQQGLSLNLKVGADTSHIIRDHLQHIYSPVEIVKTYIENISWPEDKKIEILHLDAPKKFSDIIHALKTFGPALMPNKSIIVLQDFAMPGAYSLPLIVSALSESFELLEVPCEKGTTISFKYKKPFDIDAVVDSKKWNPDDVERVWKKFDNELKTIHQRAYFNVGLAWYFFNHGNKQKALTISQQHMKSLLPERQETVSRICKKLWHYVRDNS